MKNEEVTLILAGGNLSLPFLENVIKEYAGATIIAADRGLEACMKLQIEPDYVIGDFDSLDEQVKDAFLADRRNVTKLNPIKDDTDSEAALHLAFEKTKGDRNRNQTGSCAWQYCHFRTGLCTGSPYFSFG